VLAGIPNNSPLTLPLVTEEEDGRLVLVLRAWACGFEDLEERRNTNARRLLLPPFLSLNSNAGIGVIVGKEMGIVEGLRDCSCRAAGKMRAGRRETKRVERRYSGGYRSSLIR